MEKGQEKKDVCSGANRVRVRKKGWRFKIDENHDAENQINLKPNGFYFPSNAFQFRLA